MPMIFCNTSSTCDTSRPHLALCKTPPLATWYCKTPRMVATRYCKRAIHLVHTSLFAKPHRSLYGIARHQGRVARFLPLVTHSAPVFQHPIHLLWNSTSIAAAGRPYLTLPSHSSSSSPLVLPDNNNDNGAISTMVLLSRRHHHLSPSSSSPSLALPQPSPLILPDGNDSDATTTIARFSHSCCWHRDCLLPPSPPPLPHPA